MTELPRHWAIKVAVCQGCARKGKYPKKGDYVRK